MNQSYFIKVVKSTCKTKRANKSLASYLIKCREDVVSKLDFSDGGGPTYSKSDSEGDNALLTQRTVKHPVTTCQPKQDVWLKNADVLTYLQNYVLMYLLTIKALVSKRISSKKTQRPVFHVSVFIERTSLIKYDHK